ncbi:hypothetical protein [Niallia sp. 01092]|uniref:hypothetical protein n=1 Tax=unclassified Niallia TaxID=2837522 RepID=UPI003FD49CA1
MLNIFFILIFISSVYYLLKYRLNIKKAVEISTDAIYPQQEDEFCSILIPNEWKEMECLSKSTRSYQFVKWGTVAALVFLSGILIILLATDWLESMYLSAAYWWFYIIISIRHRGNLFILKDGLIINGKYYLTNEIKSYETEQIIRWHELYGLHSRLNNAYKLTINVKKKFSPSNMIVVEDRIHLEKIILLLEEQGIPYVEKKEKGHLMIGNDRNKA